MQKWRRKRSCVENVAKRNDMKAKTIKVTKIFTFDSAHKLDDYEGKCRHLHGHTYKLEVTLQGALSGNGMVFDFSLLKKVVTEKVINQLDHKYLNEIFDFNPTSENIAIWVFEQIADNIKTTSCWLEGIRLWETATSFVELTRNDFE